MSTRQRLIGGNNSKTLGRSALVMLLLLFVPVLGLAQTTWTANSGTSQWGDAFNWNAGVPTNLTDAIIPSVPVGGLIFPDLGAVAPTDGDTLTLTIQAGASLTLSGRTLNVYGNLANSGTITAVAGGSTVALRGGADQSIDTGGSNLLDLTVNKTGGTATAGSAITVNGTLTTSNATSVFDINGNDLSVATGVTNNGTFQLQGDESVGGAGWPATVPGTVVYDGTIDYTGLGLAAGNSYGGNLYFNGAGGTWFLNANLNVDGELDVQAGIMDADNRT
ncbi:MAG: hypothetical protein KAU31_07230, partial [Spirochaetaceae bacterium]|nr:hypothetical protein [Spirochaetaceae bacterium]